VKDNRMSNTRNKKPWPTKDAMEQVYKMSLWGESSADFYSGVGSHLPEIVNPYITAVVSFLTSFDNPLAVIDLGCGDFNVGEKIVKYSKKYTAIDIVSDLINYNRSTFQDENLEFKCLDIAVDKLPSGDCVLIRQVLQHLSNSEVQSVVSKLSDYKFVIFTEHLPSTEFIPNQDIISGQGIRLKKQSGIDLLSPPFNFKVKDSKQIARVSLKEYQGVIVTTLYHVF